MSEDAQPGGELLVYQSEDGRVRVQVRLHDESVWLTQVQMAALFDASQKNISHYIVNIYEDGELLREATHKKIFSVALEGQRQTLCTDRLAKDLKNYVCIDWIKTLPFDQAIKEKDFFGKLNNVATPKAKQWVHAVDRLKKCLEVE